MYFDATYSGIKKARSLQIGLCVSSGCNNDPNRDYEQIDKSAIGMPLLALGLAPDLSELRAEVTDKLVEQFNNAVEQANETQGAHYNDLHPGDVSGDQCGNNHAKAERT